MLMLLFLAIASSLMAQISGSGQVVGPVQDSSGAAVGPWGRFFRYQTGLPLKVSSGQLTVNQQDSGVVSSVSASALQNNVGVFKTGALCLPS